MHTVQCRPRRATLTGSVILAGLFAACISAWDIFYNPPNPDCDFCGIHYPKRGVEWPYSIITAAFVVVGALGYFHIEIGWFRPRPAIAYWAALLFVPYGFSALAIAALDSMQEGKDLELDWPFCVLAFCVVWYSFGYGREFLLHCSVVLLRKSILFIITFLSSTTAVLYMVAASDSDYCISLDLQEATSNTSLAPLLANERGRDAGADVANESGGTGNGARQDKKKAKSHESKDGQWRKMIHDILRDNGVRLIAPSELQTIATVGRGGCK